MKKKNYFLVARNRDTNEFKILKVYGERATSLEKIDYATSKYSSYEELVNLLYTHNRIDSLNTDLFITYKANKKEMKYFELIYNSKEDRVQDLRNALVNSNNGNLKSSNDAKRIVDKFCQKMEYNTEFYNFIMNGNTNLYKKFLNYFKRVSTFGLEEDSSVHNKPLYSVKYADGAWVMDSYALIRNIVEAFNRFDKYSEKENNDYLNSNIPFRKLINSRLMLETSDEFIEGQLNLFDYMEMQDKISDEDKMVEIIDVIDLVDFDTFSKDGNKVSFNEKKFENYEDNDLEQLKTLLKGRLLGYFYLYSLHKYHLEEAKKYFMSTMELERDVDIDRKKIIENLRKGKNLDKAYDWCLLYTKYKNREKKVKVKDTN